MEIINLESNSDISYSLLEEVESIDKSVDYKTLDYPIAMTINSFDENDIDLGNNVESDLEPNTIYRINHDIYETDDNGNVYKVNGKLLENTTYEINAISYTTDEFGRIISWDCKSTYEPENERDNNAQIESGGEDRQEGDDGGHLVARILGGPSGGEKNLKMILLKLKNKIKMLKIKGKLFMKVSPRDHLKLKELIL